MQRKAIFSYLSSNFTNLGQRRHSELPAHMESCNAAGQVFVFHPAKACIFDHRGEVILMRKFSNRFHEILIAFPVIGDFLAEPGDRVE